MHRAPLSSQIDANSLSSDTTLRKSMKHHKGPRRAGSLQPWNSATFSSEVSCLGVINLLAWKQQSWSENYRAGAPNHSFQRPNRYSNGIENRVPCQCPQNGTQYTMAWLGHPSQSHLVTNEPRLGFNNWHSRGQDKALQDMFMPTWWAIQAVTCRQWCVLSNISLLSLVSFLEG